jgi:hypothetical protein
MTAKRFVRDFVFTLGLGASAALLAQSSSFTYDPSAEVAVAGKILHVVSFMAPDGTAGVHFDFQTPAGMLNVHVGPAMFIGMQNVSYYADDQVEIVGVKSFVDGNKAFIARSVTKDGKTLAVRSAEGTPAWTPAADGIDGCGVAHAPLPRGTEM